MVMTVAEIVRQLIEAQQNGKNINLNKYDTSIASCIYYMGNITKR